MLVLEQRPVGGFGLVANPAGYGKARHCLREIDLLGNVVDLKHRRPCLRLADDVAGLLAPGIAVPVHHELAPGAYRAANLLDIVRPIPTTNMLVKWEAKQDVAELAVVWTQ